MKKAALLFFLFFGLISGLVLVQIILPKSGEKKLIKFAPSRESPKDKFILTPTLKVQAKPIYLTIPKLKLNKIVVEHVGLDIDGKMDVPKNPDNVAWFELGYRPGKKGNSVLAGHFDKITGEPAVFYDLNNMEAGDEIKLDVEGGAEKTFIVREKKLYPDKDFPAEFVFGKSDKKMLNLITCDGTWDTLKKSYSDRLVVFTELME